MNTTTRTVCMSTLAAAMALLGACGGSSAKVENRTTTVGQELQDLDAARDKGLLTESEYQQKRKQIMNQS